MPIGACIDYMLFIKTNLKLNSFLEKTMKRRSNHKRFVRRRSRQGFTLLELMLVMAILVVLAGLATFAVLPMLGSANAGAAGVEIKTLANACKMYKIRLNTFPNSLQDLSNRPSGIDQNSWGGPFVETPCLLYTSPSPRDQRGPRMPSSA